MLFNQLLRHDLVRMEGQIRGASVGGGGSIGEETMVLSSAQTKGPLREIGPDVGGLSEGGSGFLTATPPAGEGGVDKVLD